MQNFINSNHLLPERITHLYQELESTYKLITDYIQDVETYLIYYNLVLIQDNDHTVGAEASPETSDYHLSIYTEFLANKDELITQANSRRDVIIEEVQRLEAQLHNYSIINSTPVV